jgi:hypothetical protein
VAGTTALFLAARGPGRALLTRVGPRLGLTGPHLARASALLDRRGWPAMAAGRTTPGCAGHGRGRGQRRDPGGSGPPGPRARQPVPPAHLLLGYALGPAARELLEQARLPVLAAATVALVAGAIFLLRRRVAPSASWPRVPARPAWPWGCSAGAASQRRLPTPPGA